MNGVHHHDFTVDAEPVAILRDPAARPGVLQAEVLAVIDSLNAGIPSLLVELITLGRTPTRRAADVLAHFDRPGTSTGPTGAIKGRLEHLRGTALGLRNLTNYITRVLFATGGFRPHIRPACDEPGNPRPPARE